MSISEYVVVLKIKILDSQWDDPHQWDWNTLCDLDGDTEKVEVIA